MDQDGNKTSFERIDKNGFRSEESYYDSKGTSYLEYSHTYAPNGMMLTSIGIRGDLTQYLNWNYRFRDERTVERTTSKGYNNKQRWIYKLDENRNKIEEQYFDPDGLHSYTRYYVFDGKNNLTEKTEYDGYGNLFEKWVYKYDDKGNNTEQAQYDSQGKIFYTYKLKYDDKGNLISKFLLDKSGQIRQLTVYLYQFYQ
jgi:hypothetical protein